MATRRRLNHPFTVRLHIALCHPLAIRSAPATQGCRWRFAKLGQEDFVGKGRGRIWANSARL